MTSLLKIIPRPEFEAVVVGFFPEFRLPAAADFQRDAEGRREQVIDVEKRREEAQGRVRIHLPTLGAVLGRGGRTRYRGSR